MTSIFQQLDSLIPPLAGWTDVEKSKRMAAIVLALRPDVSIETGVYAGRSFFGIALAHKFLGHGMAWGIDPWSNAAAVDGYEGENRKFWEENPLEQIYQDFIKRTHELALDNVVKIIRAKSDDVTPPDVIDLYHCDSQHTEQAVTEVNRFASRVRVGGIVVMDDCGWRNGDDAPVMRAVTRLREIGFKPLYDLGTGSVFQRTR